MIRMICSYAHLDTSSAITIACHLIESAMAKSNVITSTMNLTAMVPRIDTIKSAICSRINEQW